MMSQTLGKSPWMNDKGFSLADIACGVALGYLELRFPENTWKAGLSQPAGLLHPHDGAAFVPGDQGVSEGLSTAKQPVSHAKALPTPLGSIKAPHPPPQ